MFNGLLVRLLFADIYALARGNSIFCTLGAMEAQQELLEVLLFDSCKFCESPDSFCKDVHKAVLFSEEFFTNF